MRAQGRAVLRRFKLSTSSELTSAFFDDDNGLALALALRLQPRHSGSIAFERHQKTQMSTLVSPQFGPRCVQFKPAFPLNGIKAGGTNALRFGLKFLGD